MSRARRRIPLSEWIFARALVLFPSAFRARFAADMRDLFRDQLRSARVRAGVRGVAWLWLRTIPSLARAALLERRDALRGRRRRAAIDHSHRTRGDGVLSTILSDLRFTGRMLRKSPVFAIVAVLCVSLGSGAVTTIFSGMNAIVLRPLPGTTDPGRLIAFDRRTPDFREGISGSYAYYAHVRDHAHTLRGVAAWSKVSLAITAGGEGHAVYGNIVSGNYFSVLGLRPALGRFFLPDEDRVPLAQPVIVISHDFWTSRLGTDSGAVGQTVMVNGHPYTIVGVAPRGFRGVFTPLKTDAWVPLMMQAQLRPGRDLTDALWLWMFGRLAPGATRDAARGELVAITRAWIDEAPGARRFPTYTGIRVSDLTGLPDDAKAAFLGFTSLLLGAAALVLLIASVNVASMLSARAVARRREMALRTALGAARSRLIRQLLTETLVLFAFGAFGGVAVAWVATSALERLPVPGNVPMLLELSPDLRVLAFALAVSLLTGVICGLAPALQGASRDITSRLRDDSAASSARRSFLGSALIVGQMALSLVVLVAAGLFVRALDYGRRADPGFEVAGVLTASLNTEAWGYDDAKGRAFYRALRERVEALPGVTAVSSTAIVPLTLSSTNDNIEVTDADAPGMGREARVSVGVAAVDASYFDVLSIPVVAGRALQASDDERAPKVAVVNETFARRMWGDGNALGRTFGLYGDRVTIVGIARDARYSSLAEQTPAFAYFPMSQRWRPDQTLLVRTSGDLAALVPAIQRAVLTLDPAVPRPAVRTLQHETSVVLLPQRVAAIVTGVLGTVGLLLASVGLYGIVAYSTNRRTREIGVRVALGAQRADVLGLVVGEGARLAGVGVVLGLVLAAAATRVIASLLFGVSPLDGVTFGAMAVLLLGVTTLASYLPARRAAAADPMVALRGE